MFDSINKILAENGVFGLNPDTYLSEEDAKMMIPVQVKELNESQFLQVKETLQRVGIVQKDEDGKLQIWQTAYLLHKKGQYFICHYKHMYMLDNKKKTNYALIDQMRLNAIVHLLSDWGLVEPVNTLPVFDGLLKPLKLSVISHKQKDMYIKRDKYKRKFVNKTNKGDVK